jgi:Histidine kinase
MPLRTIHIRNRSLGRGVAVETLKGATDYDMKFAWIACPQTIGRASRQNEAAKRRRRPNRNSMRDKDVLLQEVHRRVNHDLQIVCSLLSMQSGSTNDAPLASVLRESQQRVHSMATIHETL